jgi:hypothetical protein
MAVSRAEKVTEQAELEAVFRSVDTAVLVDYRGVTVPQVTELRRQIRAAGGTYRVVKNTLAKRATAGTALEVCVKHFAGTTAVVSTGSDPVAMAKALTTFIKATPSMSIKAASCRAGKWRPPRCRNWPRCRAAGAARQAAVRAPGADAAAGHGAVGGAARHGDVLAQYERRNRSESEQLEVQSTVRRFGH